MDRAGETVLVWSLIDAAKAVLAPGERVWLCVKIGAGDQTAAVGDLLLILADRAVDVPKELSPPLRDWVYGYLGSDSEPRFRSLLTRLRVPGPWCVPATEMTPRSAPFERRPRRVGHGPARTILPTRTADLEPVLLTDRIRHNGLRSRETTATTSMTVLLVNQTNSTADTTTQEIVS